MARRYLPLPAVSSPPCSQAHHAEQTRAVKAEAALASLREDRLDLGGKFDELSLQLKREKVQRQLNESCISSQRSALNSRQEEIEAELRQATHHRCIAFP